MYVRLSFGPELFPEITHQNVILMLYNGIYLHLNT